MQWLFDYFGWKDQIENVPVQDIYKRLFEICKANGVDGIDNLFDYMSNRSDFFDAPASTRFHGNYDGALAIHELNVIALFLKKNQEYELGLTDTQCIIAAGGHDLCKCNFYGKTFKNTKVYYEGAPKHDAGGDFDWKQAVGYTCEDKYPLGHGNKSLFILMKYIPVDATVAMLITWHMGQWANTGDNSYGYNNACDWNPAVCAMHTADAEASTLFEIKVEEQYVD